MPEDSENLEEAVEVLKDIRRWVKIIGIQEAKGVLEEFLTSEDKDEQQELRIIYHLTDGEHSIREIAQHISSSRGTVRRRQNEWARAGLVEREGSYEPYEHVISLVEAGLEVPDIPEPEIDEEEDENESDSEGDDREEEEDTENEEETESEDGEPSITDYE